MKYGQHTPLIPPEAFTRRSIFDGYESPRDDSPATPLLHAQESPPEPPPIPSAPLSFGARPERRPIVHRPDNGATTTPVTIPMEPTMSKSDGAARAARMTANLTAEELSERARKGHATRRAKKLGLPIERPERPPRPRCGCGAALRVDSRSDQCYRCRNGQKPRARKSESIEKVSETTTTRTTLPPVSSLPADYLAECVEEAKRRVAELEAISRALRSAA